MSDITPLQFHVPEPPARPGDQPDFSYLDVPPPAPSPPDVDVEPAKIRDLAYALIRVLDDDGRAVGPVGARRRADDLRARPAGDGEDARLRRSHAAGAAPGQDVVLHALHRRGGVRRRPGARAGPRRHVLPDVPPAGLADRPRLAARRHDVPDLLQREGPAARPADAGHVLGPRGRVLHDLRQPRHAVHPGRRLGDGGGHQGRHGASRRAWSAKARRPRPTSTTP